MIAMPSQRFTLSGLCIGLLCTSLAHAQRPPESRFERQQSNLPGQLRSSDVSDYFARLLRSDRDLTPQQLQLATLDQQGASWWLHTPAGQDSRARRSRRQQEFALTQQAAAADAWWLTPAGANYVRVQTQASGQLFALTLDRGGALSFAPVAQNSGQLWEVLPAAGGPQSAALLANARFPGQCLTHAGRGRLIMQPIQYSPMQYWIPLVPPQYQLVQQPVWRSTHHEIVPQPPLPPAEVELLNSHRNALLVLLGDVQSGEVLEQIRIDPATSATVVLDRGAGATLIETYEIRSPLGGWEQQQFTTQVPAARVYDLSVYEEHLQSIAIDRTGKSPNPIEDINYVPKSVGALSLIAGPELPERSRIDVFARALAARNPGAVRRLDMRQAVEPSRSTPLEDILEEFQSTPRRKF